MRRCLPVLLLLTTFPLLLARPAPGAAEPATPQATAAPREWPSQPAQPTTGPGGSETPFAQVDATFYGDPAVGWWLFEPTDPLPSASEADGPLPVVIFVGGCCPVAANQSNCRPDCHMAWIEHLARMGNLVVYPNFRADHADADIADGVRAALAELAKPGHPPPDLGRVALFGWSFGGLGGPNYAATAAANSLPVPSAMMFFGPGCEGCVLRDLSPIPADTRLVMVVGSDDDMVGEDGAKQVWAALPQVPADRRAYVRLVTDRHGIPSLVTDHALPATAHSWATVDALDWYGIWRPFDALLSCTWGGVDCDLALGDSPERTYMGTWSDGVPVTPAVVVPDPGPPLVPPYVREPG